MKKTGRSPMGLFMIGIMALFLAGFLMLVLFGAGSYRNTVAGQQDNMQARALLAYLSASVKGGDSENAVSVRVGQTGPALLVADGDTGYGLHIYQAGGKLVEEYKAMDAPEDPNEAHEIAETQIFDVTLENGLLTVQTDAGRVLVHLRSGEVTP